MSKLLFQTQTGSRAYGLELESSDFDVLRVVAHGADEYLGLRPYKESQQFKNSGQDVVDYDFRFFARLLCAGNPNSILPLFFDRKNYAFVDPAFEQFLLSRRSFLGSKMVDSFRGMAYQGQKQFEADRARWKSAANGLYMLTALKSLALSGGLGFDVGELLFLRNVKKGNVDVAEVKSAFEKLNRTTTKEVLGFYKMLSTQEEVAESVSREVVALLKKYV